MLVSSLKLNFVGATGTNDVCWPGLPGPDLVISTSDQKIVVLIIRMFAM